MAVRAQSKPVSEYHQQVEQAAHLKSVEATLKQTEKKIERMDHVLKRDRKRAYEAERAHAKAQRDAAAAARKGSA